MDLAIRLRVTALTHFAENAFGRVTCPSAEQALSGACRDLHDGHLCRWADSPEADGTRHRGSKHQCSCYVYWGEGREV